MITKDKLYSFFFDKKGWIPLLFFFFFILSLVFIPTIIAILIAAFFAAYAIEPLICFFSSKLKISRLFLTILTMFLVVSAILLLLLIILPNIISQIYKFFANFDDMIASTWNFINLKANEYFDIKLEDYYKKENFLSSFNELFQPFLKSAFNLSNAAFKSAFSLVSTTFNFLIFVVLAFFTSYRYPQIKNSIFQLIPLSTQPSAKAWIAKFDAVLSGFIRGQLTVCFILGCVYAGAFAIAGIQNAGSLGAITGTLCFAPYVGLFIAIIISLLLALLTGGPVAVLKVLLVFIVVQIFDTIFITPNVMGKKVGISPVLIIIAIFAGAEIGGFLGVLIAVPAFAIIKLLTDEILTRYKASDFYNSDEVKKFFKS